MNNQQAFDKMVTHAFTQKRRAFELTSVGVEQCRYRTEGGNKCFVGALLPDADYQARFEGSSVGYFFKEIEAFKDLSLDMLNTMQYVHDYYKPPLWLSQFKGVAEQYKLDDTLLKTFEEVEL